MWFKVDDQFHEHPKLRAIDYDLAALGLWTLAGSWCGDNSRDGFVPVSVLRRWTSSGKRHASTLVRAGLWEEATVAGETGWRFHDWGDRNPTHEETSTDIGRLRWQRKNDLSKDRKLREAIVARDKGLCRYCGIRVNWKDRRGAQGGTYDHVDPDGPNTLDNVVVACRRCNGRKKDRTPEEAVMPLLAPGTTSLRSGSGPSAGASSGAGSDLAPPTRDGAELGRSRVGAESGAGSGVRSGPVGSPSGVGPFDDVLDDTQQVGLRPGEEVQQ